MLSTTSTLKSKLKTVQIRSSAIQKFDNILQNLQFKFPKIYIRMAAQLTILPASMNHGSCSENSSNQAKLGHTC